MEQVFWATLAGFCALALAIELCFHIVEDNERNRKAPDPYRLERFRNGEPLDPDENP